MKRFFILLLLTVLLVATTFGWDLSLAPGLSVKNGFLYLIMGLYLTEAAVLRNQRFELPAVVVPFALYVAYALLSWFIAAFVVQPDYYNPLSTAISLKGERIDHFIIFLLFFYSVSTSQEALGLIRVFLWMIVLGNLLTVVDGFNIPDLGIIQPREDGRLGGPMGESNQYGALLALTVPAVIALLWDSPHTKRLLAVFACVVSVLALLAASSRGSYVGLLVGSIVAAFFLRTVISARQVAVGATAATLIVLVLVVVSLTTELFSDVTDRLLEKATSNDMFTASSGRSEHWRLAIERMLENPITFITGFGWDAYDHMRGFLGSTHNSYLNVAFNLGVPALILYLILLYNIVATCRRALHQATGVARAHLTAFVFGMTSLYVSILFVELYQPWAFIWAYIGLIMRLSVESIRVSKPVAAAAAPQRLSPSVVTRAVTRL